MTLSLSAVDASPVTMMCLSTKPTCSAWVPFAPTKSFVLPAGTGTRTVYARFRDTYTNEGVTVSDSIDVDLSPPSLGTLSVAATSGQNTLVWSGITDVGPAGLQKIRVVVAPGTTPTSCSTGTLLWEGLGTSYTHNGVTPGVIFGYRVCGVDNVGWTSSGMVAQVRAAN